MLDEQKTTRPGMDGPAISLPFFTGVVGALFIGAAIASLGIACLVLFGDRLAEWWGRTHGQRHPLAAAVDESLDDLGGEVDARLAIIRCYRRFEHVLASSRFPRAPWQTPLEFMRDALARLPLPPVAVERLTRLFERARFSNEPLALADRDHRLGLPARDSTTPRSRGAQWPNPLDVPCCACSSATPRSRPSSASRRCPSLSPPIRRTGRS